LAVQIMAVTDKDLEEKLAQYKNKMAKDNEDKGNKLSEVGYKKYLDNK